MKIIIFGTGNVAWHLSHALLQSGEKLLGVVSRNPTKNRKEFSAPVIGFDDPIIAEADLIILAVKDYRVSEICISIMSGENATIVHTSGSLPIHVFDKSKFENFGVLYPLQTFTRAKKLDISQIPFFIEANNKLTENQLILLVSKISNSVVKLGSEQREKLHIAAVFVSNFVNHMYHVAAKLMETNGLNFDLLKPLILETANKILELHPKDAQTGPASRKDIEIIRKHLELIKDPQMKELYKQISQQINNFAQNES